MPVQGTRFVVCRAVLLALGIPLSSIAFVICIWIGLLPFGNSYDSVGECVVWGGFRGVPAEEVQASVTYWPLGLVCRHAGTVIAHQNWPATILGYGCGVAAVAGVVVLVLLLVRWQRGRGAAAGLR